MPPQNAVQEGRTQQSPGVGAWLRTHVGATVGHVNAVPAEILREGKVGNPPADQRKAMRTDTVKTFEIIEAMQEDEVLQKRIAGLYKQHLKNK